MKTRIVTTLLTAVFLVTATLPANAQTTEQLFQKGIMKEEGEGNLPEAIEIFNSIVEDSEADDALQAKALLHVGLCYEKLGKSEASRAYQKLINNFPTRKNEVAIARERLSMLILAEEKAEQIPLQPKWTKIDIPTELSWSVAISPDGKDLALVSDKKLWKMPLSSKLGPDIPGTPVQINTDGLEVEWTGLSWSRDGELIAFNESPEFDESNSPRTQTIFIVPSKGGKPEKIIDTYRDVRVVNYRLSLSPEAKKLAFSSVKNNKQHIYSIPIKGKVPKKLVDFEAREPVFSPDGKYIAFVKDQNRGIDSGDLGVWIVRADGGKPWKIADAGKASSPVWSPDGRMIAYLDYTKGKQIFVVPFDKSSHELPSPLAIKAPEGTEEIRLLAGWTPENRIGALISKEMNFGLYTLPAKGGQAAKILTDTYALQPRWSKDGKQIYYVGKPKNENYKNYLASVPADGGEGKPLSDNYLNNEVKQFSFQGGNKISPNGKWIISSAWTKADTNTLGVHWPTSKIWKIATDGTEAVQITDFEGNYTDLSPCWSPDGEKIAFIRKSLKEDNMNFFGDANIYITNELDSNPKMIISEKGTWMASLTWSPDEKKLAWTGSKKGENEPDMLKVFDLDKKEIFATYEIPASGVNIETAWSPDSKKIAFNDPEGKVIKVIDIENGNIENVTTGLVDIKIHHLDWSPDGKRFVFGGYPGGGKEFWFVEDFLPLDKMAQKEEADVKQESVNVQKVWTDEYTDNSGTPSPDERFLSYMDGATGNLAIRDLPTGQTHLLTKEGTWDEPMQFTINSTVSPDTKRIAYSWYNTNENYEIKIVDKNNPNPKIIYSIKGEDAYPCCWSPDGTTIYARCYLNKTHQSRILAINVENGEFQVLKTFDFFYWMYMFVSPDNKFIAYDLPQDSTQDNFDICIISTDGKHEYTLVEHPANDRLLGWFPDKNQILFRSNRSGTWDAWTVVASSEMKTGEPKRILTEIGQVSPMGFTNSGNYYYSIFSRKFTAFEAPFNQITGELSFDKRKPLLGSIMYSKWSPNGRHLAYTKEITKSAGPGWYKRPIFIYDINTGKEHNLTTNFETGYPKWSVDGKSLLMSGYDKERESQNDYVGGIYKIDAVTGHRTLLFDFPKIENDEENFQWWRTVYALSKDQKNIFYIVNNKLINRNLSSGKEKIVLQNKKFNRILELSPNGKFLLYSVDNQLKVIPSQGGEESLVFSNDMSYNIQDAVWSADGNNIIFCHQINNKNIDDGSILNQISFDGKNLKEIWQSKNLITNIDIHPDGNKIVCSTFNQEMEIWRIVNLDKEVEKIYSQNE